MLMPKAINQAEIDAINADYEKKIAECPAMEAVFRMQCESDVATAIGRQRQAALAAGGELAEQIKAENEELKRQAEALRAEIPDEAIEAARAEVNRIKAQMDAENSLAANPQPSAAAQPQKRFCTNCGASLAAGAKFCTECGARV